MTTSAAPIVMLDDAPTSLGLHSVRLPFSRTWERSASRPQIVVSSTAQFLRQFPAGPVRRRRERLLLLSKTIGAATLDNVERIFDAVVVVEPSPSLVDILRADNRDELFIAGGYDPLSQQVLLHRGDLSTLVIPLVWFASTASGPAPDPYRLRIVNHGQTVALGDYQASADAILYEHDVAYRARAKKRALDRDRSFGGSLKRLRLQKGLDRRGFEPELSAKTIARIERNEVAKPRGRTLSLLAKKLAVKPKDIASY